MPMSNIDKSSKFVDVELSSRGGVLLIMTVLLSSKYESEKPFFQDLCGDDEAEDEAEATSPTTATTTA